MALTSKELSWIEDQLTLEQLLIKKYRDASKSADDAAIAGKMASIAERHEKHYNTLFKHLNTLG